MDMNNGKYYKVPLYPQWGAKINTEFLTEAFRW